MVDPGGSRRGAGHHPDQARALGARQDTERRRGGGDDDAGPSRRARRRPRRHVGVRAGGRRLCAGGRGGARGALRPCRPARRSARALRPRGAVRPDRRQSALRRADGRAARAVDGRQPREGRAERRRPRGRALRVSPRLPGRRAQPGLRLPELVAAHQPGSPADGVRARRDRPRLPGADRAPVLDVLRLQRLEQPARGRLGDDPDQLPRVDGRRGAQGEPERGRLQPARGRRASVVGRPEARARGRDAPGRLPGRRLARQLLRSGAVPRSVWLAGRRVRRHSKFRAWSPGRRTRSSRATRPRPGPTSPGSRSRAAGASSSRRSSTVPPGRT